MSYKPPIILDGKPVEKITAFLFAKGGNDDPAVLLANANKSFVGSYVLGMGFTFDDSNPDATPIAEMHRLIEKHPRNTERIFPYIGGEEVNSSPTHSHHRYVINFGDMKEDEARQYPDLMAIVEEKVKPSRQELGNNGDALRRKTRWWLWGRYTPALFKAIAQCDRVLVISRVTQHFAFAILPSGAVYSERLVIFPNASFEFFCVMQSQVHEIWTRFFTTTHEERLTYFPSDCFETFPFPPDWETNPTLEAAGKTYYEFRADLMIRYNEGLTTAYNRFHDPDETNPDILKLRELHAQMDRAVLDAYGWTDIPTDCEFLLDYEDEDDSPLAPSGRGAGGEGRKRKKPWRYRWPEEVHDEVLARLLKLNQERAEAEKLGGKSKRRKEPAKPITPDATFPSTQKQLDLIPPDQEQLDLF
ncbi:type IIL restriction-modification enzyme MmeI [Pantanalinema rosaneae]|uniref:type IIL restriction-modification enzyme MmeI n=1 Tax=Pantanalinema rosaneae TaxID=1620701 RepID=UPI003D6EF462